MKLSPEEKVQARKKQMSRQNAWQKENVERLSVVMPKGTKARILETGETLNGFINMAIKNELQNRGV